MRKPRLFLCAITLFTMLLVSFGSTASTASSGDCTPATGAPIRIGVVFPQGNLISRRVAEPYQGVQAMLHAVNTCGGVDGRPVEALYQPANERRSATQAARTLIESENVPLIVGSGALAISEALQEASAQAGFILWEVSEGLPGDPGQQWAFSPRPNHRQLGQAAAGFAQAELQAELGLDALRVALIHEARPRGQQVAAGVLNGLDAAPVLQVGYANELSEVHSLARRIRNENMNVIMLGTFDLDASRLWYALRDQDANIAAWMHVGSSGYRRDLCQRFGNNDGFISISAAGIVSEAYRYEVDAALYALFREHYLREYTVRPSDEAMLSASGVYMLLRYVLPNVQGEYTPENIRQAIIEAEVARFSGLMGEGLAFDPQTGLNRHAGVVIQQRQQGLFCSIWPAEIATCGVKVTPFPTWRERAIMEETFICNDPA